MKNTPRFLLAALALPLCVHATNTTKTSGDLSDPAFWGGSIPTDMVQFSPNSANYTITRNVTFAGMYLNWGTISIDASANNPTITMTGPISMTQDSRPIISFKGGIYDFGNIAPFPNTSWNNAFYGRPMSFDTCVFTNMGWTVLQANHNPGNTWTLKNGAKFYINSTLYMAQDTECPGLSLNVLSGSSIHCKCFRTDNNGSGFKERRLVVSGPGSSFTCTGAANNNWSSIGFQRSGAELLVDDGASVDFTANSEGFYMGTQGTSVSNSVTVSGGATARFSYVYMGGWGGTGQNTFRILDEATVSSWTFHLNGGNSNIRNNELVVSNATLNAVSLFTESGHGSDATVRIQGENPQINLSATSGGAGQFINSTHLVFDLPREGWTNTTAIISAPNGGIWGNETTTIRVNGAEECMLKMRTVAVIPLMASSTGAQFPQSVLDAANAAMPGEALGRCEVLYKHQLKASEKARFPSANYQDIFLRVKPILATTIILR